jgi:peptidoglycan/xylan/chitin deacetylase (PgdA/CDA1 family)
MQIFVRSRKLLGWLLCRLLIAAGRVRKARERAFAEGKITALYFHDPGTELFARCIAWLRKHGYTFISSGDVADILFHGKPCPRGAVWISLDDAYRGWLEDVIPEVRRHRIPVTLFVPTGIVGGDGRFPWFHDPAYTGTVANKAMSRGTSGAREAMTIDEVKRIASYPEVEIGGHTVNHAITPHCSPEQLRFEIGEGKRALESWIGAPIRCFSYPEGRCDGREKAVLREFGFRIAVTTVPELASASSDPLRIPRLCVPDNASFPEAVCAMVGVWRPLVDAMKKLPRRETSSTQGDERRGELNEPGTIATR